MLRKINELIKDTQAKLYQSQFFLSKLLNEIHGFVDSQNRRVDA